MRVWLYWVSATALAALTLIALLGFHLFRPTEGVIELTEARFDEAASIRIPTYQPDVFVTLPDDWRKRATRTATGWYRLELELEVAPNRLWATYIPSLEMTPTIFANGIEIGGDVAPADPLPRYWNRPVLYTLPNGLLKPGRNQIDIRLAANGNWGRLTEIYLGPEETLRPHYSNRFFWRVTFLNLTTVASLIVGLFMLAFSLVRRESVYAWFSGFAFSWYLLGFFTLRIKPIVSNPIWDLFVYFVLASLVTTGGMFSYRFLGRSRPGWERTLLCVSGLGALVLAAMLPFDIETFNLLGSTLWVGLIVLLGLLPAMDMVRAVLNWRTIEVFFLSYCYQLTLALGVHDWLLVSGFGYRHNGMLVPYATAPILATFGVILMRRFISALKETDALNRDLELRVQDKAREIEITYERNRALESARLLSQERERIMRDLHDGFGGQLISAMNRLRADNPEGSEVAQDLQAALEDLRLMIDSLDDIEGDVVVALGLLRNRLQSQLEAAGMALEWRVGDLPAVPDLRPERVLHFLRILQEAVTNCIRHARASRIRIETTSGTHENGQQFVHVEVSDDGRGIAEGAPAGRGLVNMRRRAQEADLVLEIDSGSSGTRLRVGFVY